MRGIAEHPITASTEETPEAFAFLLLRECLEVLLLLMVQRSVVVEKPSSLPLERVNHEPARMQQQVNFVEYL